MKGDENISPYVFREMDIKKKGRNNFGFSDLDLSYINEDSVLRYGLQMHSILFEWRPVFKNIERSCTSGAIRIP